ncbi:chemotaxis response regulator protein-glutamate methylesterase [Cohnella faecalis]|uniref:Protein-glutamate methylesterase/protein-glutamine glutaminase n=1 Tax=Cohnella faecalis TaxID=2315694 RepID=A0A398CKR6_9BACL|nr:chemotaxis response regulator protein-glutamate methylesterase [Cohnella faecalis]RIE03303.1 chemotaxis response regulator protein-glutamate methylesterase [Cohnella faecalis]
MPKYNVLIVDDSPFMRKVFSDVVDADEAFQVLATASDGEEAVELTVKLLPDIITMDMEMPNMNGLEALHRIMEVRPTPIVMLSAMTDNGTRDTIKALQYGAFDFIRKPDGSGKLDIHLVGEQLREKLHIAVEAVRKGSFRLLPASSPGGAQPVSALSPPAPAIAETSDRTDTNPDMATGTDTVKEKPIVIPEPAERRKADGVKPEDRIPTQDTTFKNSRFGRTALERSTSLGTPSIDKKPDPIPKAPARPADGTELKGRRVTTGARHQADPAPASAPVKKSVDPSRIEQKPHKSDEPKGKPMPTFNQVVAIGTSTGGPRALHEVLTGIPADFPAPILVVQHMPPKFTHSLAQRLDSFCRIHVREAVDGEPLETSTAYIAPGGKQMSITKDAAGKYRIKLTEEGPRNGHMPSVDVLFESLIGHKPLKRHAVLMTGMGSDGAKGMKALLEDGASTAIAEAESTCIVYGMPRSAIELNAATEVLPLPKIAQALVHEVKVRKS